MADALGSGPFAFQLVAEKAHVLIVLDRSMAATERRGEGATVERGRKGNLEVTDYAPVEVDAVVVARASVIVGVIEVVDCDLLSGKETSQAFEEVANFFEFVGLLVRRKVLDKEMARSSYYARAVAFWDEASKKGLIRRAREIRPTAWGDYEYLVKTLKRAFFWRYSYWKVLSREVWRFGGRSDVQRSELLEREKKLARVPTETTGVRDR